MTERVEIPPHLDAWMQGDRYGELIRIDRKGRGVVKLDKSGRTVRVPQDELKEV